MPKKTPAKANSTNLKKLDSEKLAASKPLTMSAQKMKPATATKTSAKGAPKPDSKSKKKDLKSDSEESDVEVTLDLTTDKVDAAAQAREEAEELEDQMAEASSRASDSNAAALAAASSPSDMSASFKNFRHHPDMENFYRFIYENDLRPEAFQILTAMREEKIAERALKKPLKNGTTK